VSSIAETRGQAGTTCSQPGVPTRERLRLSGICVSIYKVEILRPDGPPSSGFGRIGRMFAGYFYADGEEAGMVWEVPMAK